MFSYYCWEPDDVERERERMRWEEEKDDYLADELYERSREEREY